MTESRPSQTTAQSTVDPLATTNVGTSASTDDDTLALAQAIAAAADERKGSEITILKVGDVSYLADYFVIVTGFSMVQVRAIARSIQDTLKVDWQREPLRTAGQRAGGWVLQDYGDVIVHVFLPQEREFYNLEAFWGHAERVPLDVDSQ